MARALMQGERELADTRQHWSVVLPGVLGVALIAAAVLVGVLLIPDSVGSVRLGGVRVAVAAAVAVVAVIVGSIRYLRWRCERYVLTNRRIIRERGVLSRDVESIELGRIQNTNMHRPLGDRFIGAGNIDVESAGRDGTEFFHRVPQCERFYAHLLEAIDGWRQGGSAPPETAPSPTPGL